MYFPAPSPPRRPHCIHNNAHTRTNTHTQNPVQPSRQHAVSAAYCFSTWDPEIETRWRYTHGHGSPRTHRHQHAEQPRRGWAQKVLRETHARTQTPPQMCYRKATYSHKHTPAPAPAHAHTQSAKAQIKGMRQDLLICGSRIKNSTMTTLLCFSGSALTVLTDFWLMTLKIAAGERKKKTRPAPTVDEAWILDGWMDVIIAGWWWIMVGW